MADIRAIMQAAESTCAALGVFDRTVIHEPITPPGAGLTLAVWCSSITPVQRVSGLDETAYRLEMTARVMAPAATPTDEVEASVIGAGLAVLDALSGDFTLGSNVLVVDILGAYGDQLRGVAGYVSLGDIKHRVFSITLPVILSDMSAQET